ncbi:hypothetical protein RvY_05127 [Ramazzottius varieornatus]|uniref:28S ribosomal protein S30, mitochondrial n=1 Tax=Ramazzottius varieornatus TaxID=947166 RepID=A0A1D1UUK1_RAMVA|nr:hypothetical protein RvY_05127 [Ramazzottius varieornatus]
MRPGPLFRRVVNRSCPTVISNRTFQSSSLRSGNQRTTVTPYYDGNDFVRDRSQLIPRSLYHQPEHWTDEPEYPEIVPPRKTRAFVNYERHKEAEKVAAMPTVKEKMAHFAFGPPLVNPLKVYIARQAKLDIRRWYQIFQPYEIEGFPVKYDALPFYKHITRTAVVADQLPADYYAYIEEAELNDIVDKVRQTVINAILAEGRYYSKNLDQIPVEERVVVVQAQNVIDALVRAVNLAVGKDFPHLREMQQDTDTRCAAFWKRGGFLHDAQLKRRIYDKASGELMLQYIEEDNIFRNFRHELPLPEVLPRESCVPSAATEQAEGRQVGYNPTIYGFRPEKSIPHWIPGHWFGDPCEFSTLSLDVPKAWTRQLSGQDEAQAFESLACNAIMASFGRIVAQAMYLGFTFLNELSYPIVTQSIMTNGRDWMFATYQANTIALWKPDEENPFNNMCWLTQPVKLFDRVEGSEVIGFNDEVLRLFIKQYLKAPVTSTNSNLRPYIEKTERSYWKNEHSQTPFYHRPTRRDGKPRQPFKPEI